MWDEIRKQFREDPVLRFILILACIGLVFALLLLWSIS